jgi:hypothetical protein
MKTCIAKHVAAGGTVTLIDHSVYVYGVILSCSNAGSGGWTVTMRDRSSTPLQLVPAFVLGPPADGLAKSIDIHNIPAYMMNGIDFVTTSGTPGVVDLWVTVSDQSS